MNKVKVALIGYGFLGRWHAEKIKACSNAELTAIVEKSVELQERAKNLYPDTLVTDDLNSILEKVNAGVIVTPTSTHADISKTLLNENKHIFVEKPLCENSEQANELKTLLNTKIVFQVGHSERCHEAWDLLRKDLKIDFSNVGILNLSRIAPFKGRATDVDVVHDLMIHDIDLILYLTKKKPSLVRAQGLKSKSSKNDHVSCTITFTDGTMAHLVSSRNHIVEERKFEWSDKDGTTVVDLSKNTITSNIAGEINTTEYPKRDHLMIEHEHFYDSIINNKDIFVTFTDGVNALRVIDTVMKSLSSNNEEKID